MKRIILYFFILATCSEWTHGQNYDLTSANPPKMRGHYSLFEQISTPPAYQIFTLVSGVPTAVASTLTTGTIPTPPAILAKCANAGAVVDCNFSGGGGTFNALTGDATSTATGGATTVIGIKNVPFCTGYTPINGQNIQYTTGGSPNPCYTAATPSGGGFSNITNLITPTGCTVTGPPFVCTVGVATAAITLASIPQTGLNLKIRVIGQDSTAITSVVGTLNGDVAAHYAAVPLQGFTSSSNTPTTSAQNSITNICALGGPGTPGGCEISIPAYSLGLPKIILSSWGVFTSISSSVNNFVTTGAYGWSGTAAITSITLTDAGTTFAAGDVVMVYAEN